MTPTRHVAWHLAGALEGTLARALASSPSDQPTLIAMAMLRMRDAERVALHNELEHVQLVLERIVQEECGVSMVLQPGAAVSLAEYALAGMWAHDRLRDGLVWRAMLMETPTQYPGVVPRESDFLRRYHDAPLALLPVGPCQPISPSVRAWMERTYEARVTGQAQALLASAANFAPPNTAAPEAAAKFGQVPGHPAWIAQSPMWASREGRAVEAALCIMKQEVDMQAMQVALLRLHKDCAQLAGLAVRAPPTSAPALSFPRSTESCVGIQAMSPNACLSAPLQVMVRHLLARKQLASHQDGAGIVYEVCAEDMAAWLSEAVAAAAAEGLAIAKAACQAAAQERAKLAQLASHLISKVSAAVSDHGMHIRRHAIRVESHLVDRAMLLLQELSYVRRAAVRSQEDAANAYEVAYMAAQTQHANIIKELQNALLVAHSNTELQRATMQRATLEAMMEVRRETLQKAFGSSSLSRTPTTSVRGGLASDSDEDSADGSDSEEADAATPHNTLPSSPSKAMRPGSGRPPPASKSMPRSLAGQGHPNLPRATSSAVSDTRLSRHDASSQQGQGAGREGGLGGGIARILDLESQVEVLEAEIIDMQRAIVKVQTWFKMRSGAFQAACMKEVVEGRARVTAIEGALWDLREAYELKLENASIQLKATQADLEVAVSSLARSSTDLTHALSSNKRLLLWKIAQAPRVEAMRTQLMARSISQGSPSTEAWLELVGSKDGPLCTEPLLQQLQEAGEAAAGRRRSPRKQRQQQQQQKDLQQPPEQAWLEERQALQDELASLRWLAAQEQHQHRQPQQTSQPLAPVSTGRDAAGSPANGDGSPCLAVVDLTVDPADQELYAAQGHEEEGEAWDAAALPVALDQEELQAAYNKAVFERSELQRLLEAVRMAAPDAVRAAEQQQGALAYAGQPSALFASSLGGNGVAIKSFKARPQAGQINELSTARPITQPLSHPYQQHQLQAGGAPHGRSLSPTLQACSTSSPPFTHSLPQGPLSTFHSNSPRHSLPLGLHSLNTSSSPSHHSTSSATHPFIRSLHKTHRPAAPSSPHLVNPASASNSPRYARPRSAAATNPAPQPADTANPTHLGGTAPLSLSVAGPRRPHSAAGPAMRLAPALSSHSSHPSPRSSVEAAGTPSRVQSAVARSAAPHSRHLDRQRMGSAVSHSRGGASSPTNPQPGPLHPHHTSVQTETPSLQVTASKLSVDPVPAAQFGAGSASASSSAHHNKFPAGRARKHGGASGKAAGHPRPTLVKNSKKGKEGEPEDDADLAGW